MVFFILMPLFQAAFIALVQSVFGSHDPFPGLLWNDEAVYLKLIENYKEHINPLGYWGFDANHAILGNGPAWSPAILFPYVLIAKIFPTGSHFVFFCNIFFMIAANTIFVLFTKPKRDECLNLLGAALISVPVILYLCTNMSELFRYAIAVVMAGMLYYLYTRKEKTKASFVLDNIVIPLFILYSTQVYIFFAFAIPLYVCARLKEKKWYVRFGISLPITGVVTLGSYYFLHLISSNYNIGKTEQLLQALSDRNFFAAIKSFLFMMKDGLYNVLLLRHYFTVYPLYPYSVIFALILIGIGVFLAIWGKSNPEKAEDVYVGRMIAHSVALFYLMYLTLYTIVPDTFYRGTQIVILFSMYLLAMCKREYLVRFMLLLSLLGFAFARPQFKEFSEGHYVYSEQKEEWNALKDNLAKVMKADPEKDLWDNTVLMYTMEPKAISAIPAGLAENFVLSADQFSAECGYLFFSKADPKDTEEGWIVQSYERIRELYGEELETNFDVLYEDESYIVYEKRQR